MNEYNLAKESWDNAKNKGFRHVFNDVPEIICGINIVGEVIELWEAYRRSQLNEPCDKDTRQYGWQLSCLEEELADIMLRSYDCLYDLTCGSQEAFEDVLAKVRSDYKQLDLFEDWKKEEPDHLMWFPDFAQKIIANNAPKKLSKKQLAINIVLCEVFAAKFGLKINDVVMIKHLYNKNRPYRNGGKLC